MPDNIVPSESVTAQPISSDDSDNPILCESLAQLVSSDNVDNPVAPDDVDNPISPETKEEGDKPSSIEIFGIMSQKDFDVVVGFLEGFFLFFWYWFLATAHVLAGFCVIHKDFPGFDVETASLGDYIFISKCFISCDVVHHIWLFDVGVLLVYICAKGYTEYDPEEEKLYYKQKALERNLELQELQKARKAAHRRRHPLWYQPRNSGRGRRSAK